MREINCTKMIKIAIKEKTISVPKRFFETMNSSKDKLFGFKKYSVINLKLIKFDNCD